jgi:hypothetical protein
VGAHQDEPVGVVDLCRRRGRQRDQDDASGQSSDQNPFHPLPFLRTRGTSLSEGETDKECE